MRVKSMPMKPTMSAMVKRLAASHSASASRRSSTFSARSPWALLYSAISGFWVSSAASAGWLWRTPIMNGVATIISARRIHISITAVSSGVRPKRLGSG